MRREILITVEPLETRAAVLEDGRLVEVLIEREQRVAGSIFKGRVENVLPGMEAAFVSIGLERNAFLHVGDAAAVWQGDEEEDAGERERLRPNIQDILHPGQEILVQVVKEAMGTKGARLTTNITLPGRYVVLMPRTDYVGVSRRITDEKERSRLRALADSLRPPGLGVIVRTVAEGRSESELARDLQFLTRLWERIQRRAATLSAPSLLHRDLGLSFRIVRDWLDENVERLWVDSRHEYERLLELCDMMSPELKKKIRLYHSRTTSLFDNYGVEHEIEKALRRKVWLKCGGYLVIDQTEALTVIDVNTGKFVGDTSLAETVLITNLEAADEIARQIRLRDLAGIIVVDFIDMDVPEDRQKVLARLEEAVKHDRVKVHILGLTELGLVEMTRKKVGQSLEGRLMRTCPHCEGRGKILSEETMSLKVRREIRAQLLKSQAEAILVETHPAVAALVIGTGGAHLRELERETGRAVYVRGCEDLRLDQMVVRALGSRSEVERLARPVSTGDVVEVRVEEPHAKSSQDGIARLHGYIIDVEDGAAVVGQKVKVQVVAAYRTYARARLVPDDKEAGPPGEGDRRPFDGNGSDAVR